MPEIKNYYTRLRDLVATDGYFISTVEDYMKEAAKFDMYRRMRDLMEDEIVRMFRLVPVSHGDHMCVRHGGSRSEKPPVIVVSLNVGQVGSPSAGFQRRTRHGLIQVFEAGTDDTDHVENLSPYPCDRIEAKGRVLLC